MAEVEELEGVKKKRVEATMMELLEQMSGRMKQVMEQTKARIFAGWTADARQRLVSIAEPQTEIIRKGKPANNRIWQAGTQIKRPENQIITHYEVFEHRPSDRGFLTLSHQYNQNKLDEDSSPGHRRCRLLRSGSGTSGARQGCAMGGGTQSADPQRREKRGLRKTPWFKKAQAWRTGCEGRIGVLERRPGLMRCRYPVWRE